MGSTVFMGFGERERERERGGEGEREAAATVQTAIAGRGPKRSTPKQAAVRVAQQEELHPFCFA